MAWRFPFFICRHRNGLIINHNYFIVLILSLPSNGRLLSLHDSCFQQMCHTIVIFDQKNDPNYTLLDCWFLIVFIYTGCLKGLQPSVWPGTHFKEEKNPVNTRLENLSRLRYEKCSCGLRGRCSLWLPCISTQLSVLRAKELSTLLVQKLLTSLESSDRQFLLVSVIPLSFTCAQYTSI